MFRDPRAARDDPRTFSLFGWWRTPAIVRAYYDRNRAGRWYRFFCEGARSIFERRLELLVDLDLVAGHQLVGFVGHSNDRLQLVKHGVGHAFFSRRRGVRSDAVAAIVGDADRDVQQFFGERVQR